MIIEQNKDPRFPAQLERKLGKLEYYSYEEVAKHNTRDDCWIVIYDVVYDVTKWVPKHPGGDIIYEFAGCDVTDLFLAFHLPEVEKKRFGYMVGRVKSPRKVKRVQKDYRELREKLLEGGYFRSSLLYYVADNVYCLFLFFLSFLLCSFGKFWGDSLVSELVASRIRIFLGGFSIGFFMHQTAALLHDSLHAQLAHNIKLDNFFGWVYGCVCFGVSSSWWKDNHNKHHAYPNCLNRDGSIKDIQQNVRPFFVQFPTILPFSNAIEHVFMKIQHLTFLPVVWLIGRYAIVVDSYAQRISHSWDQIFGIIIHWIWVITFLSYADSKKAMFATYAVAAVMEGILHLQLEMNHFCKPMEQFDLCKDTDFFTFQCVTSRNVRTVLPMEARLQGGLHLQIEHHIFPLIPRHNLHKITPFVKEICKKHNIPYDDEHTFPSAIFSILRNLYRVPRKKELIDYGVAFKDWKEIGKIG